MKLKEKKMLPKTKNNNDNISKSSGNNCNVMQLKINNKNYIGKKSESTQQSELNKSKQEKKQKKIDKN